MMSSSSLWCAKASLIGVIICAFAAGAAYFFHPILVVVLLLLSFVSACVGLFYLLKIEQMVKITTDTCKEMKKGNFESRILHIEDTGSLGEMMWSINDMIDHVDAFVRESSATMQYISRNRYFRRILPNGMDGILGHGAYIINSASDEVSKKINSFAEVAAALEASLSIVSEDVYQTVNMLDMAVKQMEQEVSQTHHETDEIMAASQIAQEKVADTVRVIKQIDSIITMIQKVASQTNLLALNASIEAARAGKAGEGFAVVAGEVKKLADQTAQSTLQITDQIKTLQTASERVSLMFFGHADDKQARSSKESATNIVSLINSIKGHSGKISESSQEVTKATELLSTRSTKQIQELTHDMENFMKSLRAIT